MELPGLRVPALQLRSLAAHRVGKTGTEEIQTLLELCFKAKSFEYIRDEAEIKMEQAIKMLDQLRKNHAVTLLSLMIEDMYRSIINAFSMYY